MGVAHDGCGILCEAYRCDRIGTATCDVGVAWMGVSWGGARDRNGIDGWGL